jgi:hypothetical protein
VLAIGAGRDIAVFDVGLHTGPIIGIAKSEISFVDTKVAEGIVSKAKEHFTHIRDTRNNKAIGDVKEAVT